MMRYSFRSKYGMIGCEGGLQEGVGFGTSEDMSFIFVFYCIDGACGGVGSEAVK